jgi:alkylation response protein AidB-like acyl-CoA dehydrogenase
MLPASPARRRLMVRISPLLPVAESFAKLDEIGVPSKQPSRPAQSQRAMNFDFSDDAKLLRDEAGRLLREHATPKAVRRILEGEAPYDAALWKRIGGMGWPGSAVPEEFGGAGLGYEGLCVLAEQLGRSLAPVPFSSSVYLAAEAILLAGSAEQKRRLLPDLASGKRIGTLALAEGPGNPHPARIRTAVVKGKVSGAKLPVPDGSIADVAVVAAQAGGGEVGLYLVELGGSDVTRHTLKTVDPTRDHARIEFSGAPAERLGTEGAGWDALRRVLDRAAVLVACEQIGGAQACLDMARAFAQERYAFGRPIGSFQAIKHKLADVYIALELARSNALYGAWALATGAPELPLAAAAARVSATDAFHLAAKENIQTHGGMGFTWESDCHLYYRRAKLLALALGSAPYWKDRLISELEERQAG